MSNALASNTFMEAFTELLHELTEKRVSVQITDMRKYSQCQLETPDSEGDVLALDKQFVTIIWKSTQMLPSSLETLLFTDPSVVHSTEGYHVQAQMPWSTKAVIVTPKPLFWLILQAFQTEYPQWTNQNLSQHYYNQCEGIHSQYAEYRDSWERDHHFEHYANIYNNLDEKVFTVHHLDEVTDESLSNISKSGPVFIQHQPAFHRVSDHRLPKDQKPQYRYTISLTPTELRLNLERIHKFITDAPPM
jgi:hypothetical protein